MEERLFGEHILLLLTITAIGSIVDIFQFLWLIKLGYQKTIQRFEDGAMDKLLKKLQVDKDLKRRILGALEGDSK